MMSRGPRILAGTLVALASCVDRELPPEGHVVVFVDTDSPLPRTGSALRSTEPMPLIDTVRVEVLTRDGLRACDRCRRELPLDEARVEGGLSFTVVDGSVHPGDARLHVVGFRAEQALAAGPLATVEVWARLPERPASGGLELTVDVSVTDIGRPAGTLALPIDLREGRPARPRRSFPGARRSICTAPRPPGAVCVPGGAFWMGSPTDTTFAYALAPRIVALSPFWLDAHEITVAELRASGIREGVELNSGSRAGARYQDFCMFTADPGRFEAYPANCVSFAAARATCAARGGDVPSEAQYEYVMSGLIALPFVWGRDRAKCGEAVLGRGPRSELLSDEGGGFHRECLPEADGDPAFEQLGFPKPITRASLGRDVLVLEGGAIQDLAGSVTEWAADGWERRDGECWNAGTLRQDPICTASASGLRVLRGASWTAPPNGLPAWWREPHPAAPGSAGISIGFRCAYPGR